LAVLDVCGAPAQTAAYVNPNQKVLILGAGGKSGMLSMIQARKKLGESGQLIALEYGAEACKRIESFELADAVIQMDATDTVGVYEKIKELTDGRMADLTINCVNVPQTEMSSILSTRDGGIIYFFSMATSFTAAALGAEGIGKDVTMIVGNGYVPGHAECALESIRSHQGVKDYFLGAYC
ncbi:MAG: L-erythro-3,5-diaminohexanoate dehydrogenase, partial [Bacilli bacterium]